MNGSQTLLKQQTMRVDDLDFSEQDIRDLLTSLAECIQELENLKSKCWSKKAMRCGCWETKE